MIHNLKGKKTGKNIVRIILLILGLVICISAAWVTWILLILGIYIIVSVFLIRDKELNVYSDKFELIGKSWISNFNNREVFKYSEIKKVRFDKRFTNVLSEIIYDTAFSPVTTSKPDTIEIIMEDERIRIINRLGKRTEFITCFKIIAREYYKFNQ